MGTRKNSRKKKSRRAVSPVIATVILVAIAITIAVAVAYWMGGIAGSFTKFEQVEIQSGYANLDAVAPTGWDITLELKNTGTATASLIGVFVNDVPVTMGEGTVAAGICGTSIPATGTAIDSGESVTIYVYISDTYESLTSGTTVNIKIHSAGGMDYIKLIELI